MGNAFERFGLFLSQILFSIITPLLLMPKIAKFPLTRKFVVFFFGKSYRGKYQSIIDSFGGKYGTAMDAALVKVKDMGHEIAVILDSGTGTGFVTRQAAGYFSHSAFIAIDLLPEMLKQARHNCRDIENILHVQADVFSLPLADQTVDLILAQNTMPCFSEYARVCRPGGVVIYVDTAAGWIGDTAKRLIGKQKLFETVSVGRVDLGFYIIAQKASNGFNAANQQKEGKQQGIMLFELLRCPLDKSSLRMKNGRIRCDRGHYYNFENDFPIMLAHEY